MIAADWRPAIQIVVHLRVRTHATQHVQIHIRAGAVTTFQRRRACSPLQTARQRIQPKLRVDKRDVAQYMSHFVRVDGLQPPMPLNQLDEPQHALGMPQIARDALLNCIYAGGEQALLYRLQESPRVPTPLRGVNAQPSSR